MSLKAVRVQRPREPQCPREAPAVKACEKQEKEWVAEPESGVLITLVSLPDGGNNIKKIRFSQKMFDDLGAQRWWSENYDKIMELYSIGPGHSSPTPPPSDNEPTTDAVGAEESIVPLRSSGSSAASSSNVEELATTEAAVEIQDKVLEWVVEDEPGVFVTLRSTPCGSREILRIEFRRERFGEVKARVWWEENKARLWKQYA
ncbi:protein Brevis radix-like 1 [Musa acuminata AAA Group]|uniref:protein Brevis radix-like 1 n=1 Tax=Musa acuminata AAA Group TaxID=214697 RepID=UPI0031E13D0B